VLVSYAFDGSKLSSPRAIAALQVRTDGHTGGGLAVLPDGSVIFAPGDNGDSYEDGGAYSQDPSVHLSKILRIDPASGSMAVAAVGVRAAQRLLVHSEGDEARVSFVDPGGWVAEELNSVPASALVDAASGARAPLNFGWGRGADGRSREGTFHLDRLGNSTGRIAQAEDGFVDSIAEFGREAAAFVAVSGPAGGGPRLPGITMLFGDLVGGAVYAITEPLARARQPVRRVSLVDASGAPVTLRGLAGGERPDPRFFNFPDGTPGILLEKTGEWGRVSFPQVFHSRGTGVGR
jgi:hypothetical protein